MIGDNERAEMVAIIDLNTCLTGNDVALAETVRDTINGLEPSDLLTNAVRDAVADGMIVTYCPASADAFRVILTGVDCVEGRDYKLTVLEGTVTLGEKDPAGIAAWLEETGIGALDLNGETDQRIYAALLIRMCLAAKRFDLMEQIRGKLKEG
jgi:hypothetical protein